MKFLHRATSVRMRIDRLAMNQWCLRQNIVNRFLSSLLILNQVKWRFRGVASLACASDNVRVREVLVNSIKCYRLLPIGSLPNDAWVTMGYPFLSRNHFWFEALLSLDYMSPTSYTNQLCTASNNHRMQRIIQAACKTNNTRAEEQIQKQQTNDQVDHHGSNDTLKGPSETDLPLLTVYVYPTPRSPDHGNGGLPVVIVHVTQQTSEKCQARIGHGLKTRNINEYWIKISHEYIICTSYIKNECREIKQKHHETANLNVKRTKQICDMKTTNKTHCEMTPSFSGTNPAIAGPKPAMGSGDAAL